MPSPFFSVIIPAYNLENFIAHTLDSVLLQIFQDFEVIVINDGSTDNTLKILEQYEAKDTRLHVITQKNSGVSKARNTGIANVCGQYIAFLDGDDYWYNNHLAAAHDFFIKYPDILWYTSSFECASTYPAHQPIETNSNFSVKNYFLDGWTKIWTGTVVVKSDLLHSWHNLFPVSLKKGEDMVAWARLASSSSQLGINSSITALYIQRSDSAMHQNEQQRLMQEDQEYHDLLASIAPSINASHEIQSFLRYTFISDWYLCVIRTSLSQWIPLVRLRQNNAGILCSLWLYIFFILHEGLVFLFSTPLRIYNDLYWRRASRHAAKR